MTLFYFIDPYFGYPKILVVNLNPEYKPLKDMRQWKQLVVYTID